jgi:Zn-dependent protease with chaperone function
LLDLPIRPQIYIGGVPGLNAWTIGVQRPIIALSSSTIDLLTDDELAFVIAHECGHIKSGHVLYRQLVEILPALASGLDSATMGLGKIFSAGLTLALHSWERASELTADRAGLLGTQNPEAAIRTFMKLAGLPQSLYGAINTEDFITQAREFQALDADSLNWLWKGIVLMERSHPWTVMRAHELIAWVDSGEYARLLAAAPRALPPPRHCQQCTAILGPQAAFCRGCGADVRIAPSNP